MARTQHRPLSSLPTTTLSWLSLKDHFIATVGPSAGQGSRRGPLLVLADATFEPHSRFPLHPHRDMEILSVVLTGTLSHHGDQAHGATIPPRSAQLISSRDGIFHAEGNDTDTQTRMLQIWFEPTSRGGAPAYFQRDLTAKGRQLIAGDDVMPLRCDAKVSWIDLEAGKPEALEIATGRHGYLLALDGEVNAGTTLAAGDGLDVEPGALTVTASTSCAVLWIDAVA
ncbi:MAG: hypothetical protein DI536_27105 [Archangium gephyra]|uniref:Pirin N-terminal domain-containing protein n=1 Tax=Archangium gephyra TaxID=48 RepID=A0A2W5T0P3_9BACT|nr:MAG: hypothetical protein DI536_27105 [Archangium gephyra]